MAATRNKVRHYTVTVATTLTATDQQRFEALLQQRGLTRSALLRSLVRQAMGADDGEAEAEPEVATVS
jgi:hypothetical protein